MRYSALFISSLILLLSSCENPKEEISQYPSFSEYKRAPTHVDSLITNKPLPVSCVQKTLATTGIVYGDRVSARFSPYSSKNSAPLEIINTFTPSPTTAIKNVKPDITEAKPFISHAYHPKPIKAGDLRSTGSSNENIMYLDVEQGLPLSNITDLVFDDKGFLWIATKGSGLIKYDGYFLSVYNFQSGMPSNSVSKILIDKDKSLWLATDAGLVNFNGTDLKIYNEKCGLAQSAISDMVFDHDSTLWFTTPEKGVYELKNDKFFNFSEKHGLATSNSCIGVDSLNRVIVGHWCANPEYIVNENSILKTQEHLSFGSNCGMVTYADKKKNLWLGAYNGGAVYLTPNGSKRYQPQTGINYVNFSSFYEDKKGKMWLGTNEGGLFRMDEDKFTSFTTREGLTSNKISCITGDKNNNIWIGTEGGGICVIKQGSFHSYGLQDGFTDKNVTHIIQNSRGDILFGTWANGLWIYDGKRFAQFRGAFGLNGNIVLSMVEDKEKNLHVAYHSHGYIILKPSRNDSIPYDSCYNLSWMNDFGNNFAFSTQTDRNGDVWSASMGQGVTQYLKTSYKRYTASGGLSTNDVFSMAFDKDNNVWLGTISNGISFMKGDHITHFTKKEGLPQNDARGLLFDHKDELWITTFKGVVNYDGKKFTTYNTKDGLSADVTTSIVEDKKHRLWVGTTKGLNLMIPDSTAEKGYTIINFMVQDGLKSIEFLPNSVCLDRENNLWWGTRKDVVKLNLNDFESNYLTPQVHLSQISLMENYVNYAALLDSVKKNKPYYSGDSSINYSKIKIDNTVPYYNYPESMELPYSINSLSFNFFAFGGNPTHHLKYRYKLNGYQDNWIETNFPEAKFTNLSYGNYKFDVQAKLDGLLWGNISSYEFSIKPPFWHTWLFRVAASLIFIGLLIFIFKLRNKQLLERQAKLEDMVKVRTKEIENQKVLIEVKQKEIVDSIHYAKRIQNALLPTEKYIDRNLNKLKDDEGRD